MGRFSALQQEALALGVPARSVNLAIDTEELQRLIDGVKGEAETRSLDRMSFAELQRSALEAGCERRDVNMAVTKAELKQLIRQSNHSIEDVLSADVDRVKSSRGQQQQQQRRKSTQQRPRSVKQRSLQPSLDADLHRVKRSLRFAAEPEVFVVPDYQDFGCEWEGGEGAQLRCGHRQCHYNSQCYCNRQ